MAAVCESSIIKLASCITPTTSDTTNGSPPVLEISPRSTHVLLTESDLIDERLKYGTPLLTGSDLIDERLKYGTPYRKVMYNRYYHFVKNCNKGFVCFTCNEPVTTLIWNTHDCAPKGIGVCIWCGNQIWSAQIPMWYKAIHMLPCARKFIEQISAFFPQKVYTVRRVNADMKKRTVKEKKSEILRALLTLEGDVVEKEAISPAEKNSTVVPQCNMPSCKQQISPSNSRLDSPCSEDQPILEEEVDGSADCNKNTTVTVEERAQSNGNRTSSSRVSTNGRVEEIKYLSSNMVDECSNDNVIEGGTDLAVVKIKHDQAKTGKCTNKLDNAHLVRRLQYNIMHEFRKQRVRSHKEHRAVMEELKRFRIDKEREEEIKRLSRENLFLRDENMYLRHQNVLLVKNHEYAATTLGDLQNRFEKINTAVNNEKLNKRPSVLLKNLALRRCFAKRSSRRPSHPESTVSKMSNPSRELCQYV